MLDPIRSMPLFAGCTDHELRAVVRMGTTIIVEQGHVLTRQGRRGYEFFVVIEGRATCSIDGTEIAAFGPGGFFGEIGLASQQPRTATVVADSMMKVLVIDCREFGALLELAPTAARRIRAAMTDRLSTPAAAG